MKIKIDKNIRLRQRQVSNELKEVRRVIARRIQEEYKSSIASLSEERESLWTVQKDFLEDVAKLMQSKAIDVGVKVKVVTQVGPYGGVIFNEYEGTIMKIQDRYKPCFNLSDPKYLDGKEFTIGGSCLQSIEIIEKVDEVPICKHALCKKEAVDMDLLWCEYHDKQING